jgi:predicted PurR-regulated permease PerM
MNSDGAEGRERGLTRYAIKVIIAVGITVVIAALLTLMALAVDVLLLGFAGILLAVLLRGVADLLARHSPLRGAWSVLVVIVALLLLIGGLAWLSESVIMQQIDTLTATLPREIHNLQRQMLQYRWGQWLVEKVTSINWSSPRVNVLGKMTGALSSVVGLLADFVIICFLGIYLAFKPQLYINGAIRLAPVSARPRMREVLHQMGYNLQWWLIGIFCSMTIIGAVSGIGLWLMGIPFALVLGLLAGVLSFIPYLGAIISSIPAILIAFTHGPEYALYVAGLYLGVHFLEGYLLNPLIQQYAISLPPALLLFAQIMLGILLGALGIILAAPIAAVLLVLIKMVYVEDLLGDRTG